MNRSAPGILPLSLSSSIISSSFEHLSRLSIMNFPQSFLGCFFWSNWSPRDAPEPIFGPDVCLGSISQVPVASDTPSEETLDSGIQVNVSGSDYGLFWSWIAWFLLLALLIHHPPTFYWLGSLFPFVDSIILVLIYFIQSNVHSLYYHYHYYYYDPFDFNFLFLFT